MAMTTARRMEHIAGQRIMAGFHGTGLNADLKFLIDTIGVGGIIVFARNIESRAQLARLCADAAAYTRSCGLPDLLIAIDQEGGTVARLKAPEFTEFSGLPAMKDERDAIDFADITANELHAVGINMDMAPVMDVAPPDFSSIMSERIFGTDPAWVSKMGAAMIDRLQENGILAVAKHFPGIGRTTLDSHLDLPVLETPREALEAFDFIPFEAAIRHQVTGIMLSHIRYMALDPIWPASLSPEIVRNLLRTKMGYDGLVLTDDLEMGAVKNYYDMPTIATQVLAADVDIALICKTRTEIETAWEIMARQMTGNTALARMGEKSLERLEAVRRRIRKG